MGTHTPALRDKPVLTFALFLLTAGVICGYASKLILPSEATKSDLAVTAVVMFFSAYAFLAVAYDTVGRHILDEIERANERANERASAERSPDAAREREKQIEREIQDAAFVAVPNGAERKAPQESSPAKEGQEVASGPDATSVEPVQDGVSVPVQSPAEHSRATRSVDESGEARQSKETNVTVLVPPSIQKVLDVVKAEGGTWTKGYNKLAEAAGVSSGSVGNAVRRGVLVKDGEGYKLAA